METKDRLRDKTSRLFKMKPVHNQGTCHRFNTVLRKGDFASDMLNKAIIGLVEFWPDFKKGDNKKGDPIYWIAFDLHVVLPNPDQ
jgi:hypothetical protein